MTSLLVVLGIAGTALLGGAVAFALSWRPRSPGDLSLRLGVAYPLGALLVAAWMEISAILGLRASTPLALAPVVMGAAYALWRLRDRMALAEWRHAWDLVAGRSLSTGARRVWLGLLIWLLLRFVLLAFEATSRPPLPWEAWLHAAGRAQLWHLLREPAAFVPESAWWQSSAYLAGLPSGSRFTAALDAWTSFAAGFDDTSIHLPWVMFLAAQPAIAYGVTRYHGATPLAALLAAAFVATIPLSQAHAALGGTAALPLATFYLGAFAFAWRASRTGALGDIALAALMAAGMLAVGGRLGALWLATLAPFALGWLEPALLRKALAGLLGAAALVAMLVAQNRLFAPPTPDDVALPGLAALLQHALLLGNWHVLPYAAIAAAVVGFGEARKAPLLAASATMALGLIALIGLITSSVGRGLVGSTGSIGHAALVLAPTLALWTAWVALALWTRAHDANAEGAVPAEDAPPPAAPPAPRPGSLA